MCFFLCGNGQAKGIFVGNFRLCAFPFLKWEAVFAVQSQAVRLSCAEMGRRKAVVQSQAACFSWAEMGRRKAVFDDQYLAPLLKWEAIFAWQSQAVCFSCAEMGRRKAVLAVQSQAAGFFCAEKGRRKAVFLQINLRKCAFPVRKWAGERKFLWAITGCVLFLC